MEEVQKDYSDYCNPENYILVASTYYKRVLKPNSMGTLIDTLERWDRDQIQADFRSNQEAKRRIERYDGFCVVPMHQNYQRRISNYYNRYEDIGMMPRPGEWGTIKTLMQHIFGEQYEEGLDYVQLLYTKPMQKLPILLIVSRERNTGKTTFLNFLKDIFKGNMTFISNDDLRSRFNSDWATKLIVAVDETLLSRREDSEKIKALSTAKTSKLESKGQDRQEITINVKLILCSNNADDPVYIDKEEDRYWVRQVPPLNEKDPDMASNLRNEIPAFVDYLLSRELKHPVAQERMWFKMADLETPALRHIKRLCGPKGEIDLAETLLEVMDAYSLDVLCLSKGNILTQLENNKVKGINLHEILHKRWDGRIERPKDNLTYTLYQTINGEKTTEGGRQVKGRFYRFTRDFLLEVISDEREEIEEDLPFFFD